MVSVEGATYCHGNHITGSGIARKKRLVSLFLNFLEGEGGGTREKQLHIQCTETQA